MVERRLSVRLSATGGDQTRRELSGVGAAGTRLGKEMDAAALRLKAFGDGARRAAQVATAALGAALGLVTQQASQAAFEAERLATVAGTTPQALQALGAATATVGIELEKYADILKDVRDKSGDFIATGGGEIADFFEKIGPRVGVTAEMFRNLSGPDALQLYFDSLERANVSQAETVFYLEAIANDASLLIPLLKNSGAEMQRLAEQAQAMGVVIDRQGVAALQDMRSAVTQAGQVLTGFGNQIAVAIAPVVAGLARAFTAAAAEGGVLRQALDLLRENASTVLGALSAIAALIAGRMLATVAAFALGIRGAATALVLLRGALLRLPFVAAVIGMTEVFGWFGKLVQGAGSLGAAWGLLGDVAQEVWDRVNLGLVQLRLQFQAFVQFIQAYWIQGLSFLDRKWAEFLQSFSAKFDRIADLPGFDVIFPEIATVLRGLAKATDGATAAAAQSAEAFKQAFGEANKLLAQAGLLDGAISAPLQSVKAIQEAMAKSAAAAAAATDAAAASAGRLQTALAGVPATAGGGAAASPRGTAAAGVPALPTPRDLVDQTGDTARDLTQAITGPLKQALQQGELSWKAFGDTVVQIMQNVASRVLEAAFKPLEEGLQSLFASLLGGGASDGSKKSSGGSILGQVLGAVVGAVAGGFGGGGGKAASSLSKGFARGGAFGPGGEITRFADGGIVDRRTPFLFGGGQMGEMGEAGTEGILPLRKDAQGRLGVNAAVAPQPSFKIVNVQDPAVVGDYLSTAAGERLIMNVIRRNKRVLAGV